MHYLLDGYNILFRRKVRDGSFEEVREKFIHELDIIARALRLQITLVLDAYKKKEEEKRHHFRSLEIIYTSFGQTADEHIVDHVLRLSESARKTTVIVTSDRELQRKVKAERAVFLSVSSFFHDLEKKILKKYPQKSPSLQEKSSSKKEKSTFPPLMDTDAWITIFEKRAIDQE